MKKFIKLIFCFFLLSTHVNAQVFQVDTLLNNGNKNNRINLVFLGDGYTSAQQTQFITDVNTMINSFFQAPPLNQYKSFFNVYAVRVVSAESGAKHPNTSSDCSFSNPLVPTSNPNNLLGATFDYGGTHRLLYCTNTTAINNILQTNTPFFDKALILVNSTYYGGSGGTYAIGSIHPSSAEIMIHEFGHSFAQLADEYGGGYCSAAEKPNVTQQTNPSLIKWKNWIISGTALPTPANTGCINVGLYEGANYCNTGWYRPKCDCKMRTLGQPFCEVCIEQYIVKIMQYVSLIDSYTPSNNTMSLNSGATQNFTSQILFNNPNTIKVQWKVDNNIVANNVLNYSFNASLYSVGAHTVSVSAWDTTSRSRQVLPVFTNTWNITISGSGGSPSLIAFQPTCSNSSQIQLTGGSPVGGTYSGPGVSAGYFNPAIAGPGTHTITYTYNSQTATQTITVNSVPSITGSNNTSICNGSNTSLNVSGANTYSWSPATGINNSTAANVIASPINTTTYTITGTANSCSNTKTIVVTVNAIPTLTSSSNTSICNGSNTSLTISGASTYTWSPGTGLNNSTSSLVTASPSSTTTYTITGTANSCSNTKTIVVTVNAIPTLTSSSNTSICNGSNTSLSISGASIYSWSPSTGLNNSSSSSVTASPSSTITYTITGTQSGCSATKNITVTVNPIPTLSNSGNSSICSGSSSSLSVSGATSYTWSPSINLNNSNTSIVVSSALNTTTYTIAGTDANGCSNTTSILLTVNQNPVLTTSGNASICNGNSALLNVSGANSYTWSPSTGLSATNLATVSANPPSSITYTITGNTNGCASQQTLIVSTNTSPVLTSTPNIAICSGSNTSLTISGANVYTWTPSTGLNNSTSAIVTASPSSTTTYTITGTQNGCSATKTITVTVNPVPTVTMTTSLSICNGSSLPLSASGATSYSWSPSSGLSTTTSSSVNASPSSTTTYTVTGTTNGCSNTSTMVLTINPSPILTSSSNTSICSGSNSTLTISGANTYSWSPSISLSSSSGASVIASPSSNTTYTITGSANGCNSQKTIIVGVTALPVLNSVNTSAVCAGASTTLNISGATSYTWIPVTGLNNSTSSVVNAMPVSTTTYSVTGTNSNGCSSTSSMVLTINPIPTLITSANTSICNGSSVPLNVSGANTYSWSPAITLSVSSGSNVVATPTASTTYIVTGNANGCNAQKTIVVNVNSTPVIASAISNTNCSANANGAIDLSVSNGSTPYTYSWNTGASIQDLNNLLAGNYSVTVSGSNGCSSTNNIIVQSDVCGMPTNILSTSITSSQATIKWQTIPCSYGYKIRRRVVNSYSWSSFSVSANDSIKKFFNLIPNSNYEYQIQSYCNPAMTDSSGYTSLQFFTTGSMCFAPNSLSVSNITSTTASCSWSSANNSQQYRIRYQKTGTVSWTEEIVQAGTSYTITGLSPATQYKYQVRNICDLATGEVSNWSAAKVFSTIQGLKIEEENSSPQIEANIYPNPVSNILHLNAYVINDDEVEITLMDLSGRILESITDYGLNSEINEEFNITNYSAGMYLIQIRKQNEVVIKRFVKD